ncbi:hypothetical protein [Litoreibacter albidus]|uniref:hypothetical protein n=1 Tax=Litoreibacter albidus TaxID=670155 RepID=UPI003736BEFA
MTRIVLIHATRVAMAPIEDAFKRLWPDVDIVSILEEGLSSDAATGRVSLETLNQRINRLADYAMDLAPDAILYTCSAFGAGIEAAAARLDIPVLKPNEAMFEAAVATGGAITMLYTFPPAVTGMEIEFTAEAGQRDVPPPLTSIEVPYALEALKSGDGGNHDHLIAEAATGVANADAIMLAHFSMSRAADEVRARTNIPVLTSPDAAVEKLKRMLSSANLEGTLEC